MPKRTVDLTDSQAALIDQWVAAGAFRDAGDAVSEGLRLLEARHAEYAAKREALLAAIQVGIDDIEAGRFTEFDSAEALAAHMDSIADQAIAEAEARLAAEAEAKAPA